jgi:signal transduction histidine kinase
VVARRVAQREGGAECDPAFDYFSLLNPEFTVLLLWSPQGEVRCPLARRSVRYEDARRPPWLAQALQRREPLVSEPYRGPLSGRWIAVLAHPVIGARGEIAGVLDLSVDLGSFPPVTLPVGGGVEFLAVLDGRGRIAASAAAEGDQGREAGLVASLPGGVRDGSAIGRGADGIERIYAAAPIPGTDWIAVAGVPVDRVFEKANQALVASMLLALVIVLTSSYLAYRISLAIERPIIITARTAQAVARGDTTARAPVMGPAETRVVARQFNAMLDGRAESEQKLAELLEQERAARAEAEHARNELAALRDGLESEVAARTRELLERNREMETFSYSVSHDVRAPLRSILGFAGILEAEYADRLDAQGLECLRNINQAVERMDALTTGLISLARLSRAELMPVAIDLSALAREIVDNLRRADPDRKVEVNIADGLQATADVTLTRIALDNLLGNAWKYTASRESAQVTFGHVRDDRGDSIFFVRDNGAGFDMAYAQRLFQPFQRMHRRDEFPGTGIGLATVRRIIERHGGRIWAESTPDAGTTIYFTLGG